MWRRFERAYRAGEVEWSGDTSSWAALPEDRARLEALRPTVERALQIDPARRVVLRGECARWSKTRRICHQASCTHWMSVGRPSSDVCGPSNERCN